ncbi:NADH-quinone oxidoreductase subunit L [Buchnera aphidicola]|uniref:NADH-quinone oxidoreductase subunit L n=1 Tax=Buchnera aphidicola (Sarucallis kahawaluokalani) TaxID=1241878 RepID=A0A4D6Y978_9GAMM|nr:NADH-quinone oxidoreductase subunit L [Buchnera aphidicola]QCI25919.1 NADH-quinone oxidoreductase subunit L [Buchnera aphidicola (Sarucallis kahawaluokalani)]
MNIIYLVIFFPLISFIFLFFFKNVLSYKIISFISFLLISLSVVSVCLLDIFFFISPYFTFEKCLWSWWNIQSITIDIGILIDSLTCVFLSMITIVACLVYFFSIWYMQHKTNNIGFFELVNLFLVNMLILVISNNFLFMYLGWEGISVCSYLLINFYYSQVRVNYSAMKSFIFTKVGDLFLITAILLLYIHYHTLNFYEIAFLTKIYLIKGTKFLQIVNVLLLIGAIGKSAQIPLQIWLPEAMVGPTPVSALIHAATMVTSGIYLILRNYNVFILTPHVLYMIGIVGGITLILSSIVALVEIDIKRILAYSTMSQIGYIFIALSVGACNAAVMHLIIHAIFKALLFLSAGVLISKCCYEQNIFRMGNQLYKRFPFLYVCFLIGGVSLAGFPIFTAGFYSKEGILLCIYNSKNMFFFIIAILSIILTTLYIFRLIFVTFHTSSNYHITKTSMNCFQYIPLIIFSIFSTTFGILILPNISNMFPMIALPKGYTKFYLESISSILVILNIFISYYFYILRKNIVLKIFILKCLVTLINFIKDSSFGFYYIYELFFLNIYLAVAYFLSRKPFNVCSCFVLFLVKKINFLLISIEDITLNVYIMLISLNIIFVSCLIILY